MYRNLKFWDRILLRKFLHSVLYLEGPLLKILLLLYTLDLVGLYKVYENQDIWSLCCAAFHLYSNNLLVPDVNTGLEE